MTQYRLKKACVHTRERPLDVNFLRLPKALLWNETPISRRTFLQISTVMLLAGLTWQEVIKQTERVYGEQNKAAILALLQQSLLLDPSFGIIADPRRNMSETITRAAHVKEGVGQLQHIGIFTRLEDFRYEKERESFLNKLSAIHKQGAIPFIALGGGGDINGQHMLAAPSSNVLDRYMENVISVLQTFGHPVVIRFLFEMNTKNFGYSKHQFGISTTDQVNGFQRAARSMHMLLQKQGIREQVELMFNPTFEEPFTEYASDSDTNSCFDVFGLDLYDFSLVHGVYIGNTLLPPGKVSPSQVISGPIKELQHIAKGKKTVIAEFGSLRHDTKWIQHMVLSLLVNNVSTLSYFDSNESDKRNPREGDFRITQETMNILRTIFSLVQILKSASFSQSDLENIQQHLRLLKIPLVIHDIHRMRT